MQLITTLNTKSLHSEYESHQTQSQVSQPSCKPPQITLKKSDYLNIKHWERQKNNAIQFTVIKVYNTDHSDSDSDSEDAAVIKKQESGVLAFLEDKNDKVIDYCERKRLYFEL